MAYAYPQIFGTDQKKTRNMRGYGFEVSNRNRSTATQASDGVNNFDDEQKYWGHRGLNAGPLEYKGTSVYCSPN